MNRKVLAIKGSITGLLSQITNIVLKFIIRTFTIRFLGREVIGLDTVLIDTVSMLSLAELGITTVMTYRLYSPIINKDFERVNQLLSTYKLIYRVIAGIVGGIGFIIIFFLPVIITKTDLSWKMIYVAYSIRLIGSVTSYLLAYYRILLSADQKNHLIIVVDTVVNIITGLLQIICLVLFKNYLCYCFLVMAYSLLANISIYLYTQRNYSYLDNKVKPTIDDINILLLDTKDVLGNKIANYIYSSTDNIIISTFRGVTTVGILSNYRYLIITLRGLVNGALATLQPLIGNYLNSNVSHEKSVQTLMRYSFVRFIFIGATMVPFVVLANDFIIIWTGRSDYLLPTLTTVLLALDYYIGCMSGPLGEYILGLGQFKVMRNITIVAAISNIIFSILGVVFVGYQGVLFATIICQIIIWIGDYKFIFLEYYSENRDYGRKYIAQQIYFVIVMATSLVISEIIYREFDNLNLWAKFFLGGCISILIFLSETVLFFRKNDYYKYFLHTVTEITMRRRTKT